MASGTEKELHIRESEPASQEADIPRVKPSPKSGRGKIPVPFEYIPSDDGTDENLLVLLHGLGAVQIERSWFALNYVVQGTRIFRLRNSESSSSCRRRLCLHSVRLSSRYFLSSPCLIVP